MANKKGISPLIATVLVIGFTIVLAALVITWGTKMFKDTVDETEAASQFNLACTTGLRIDASADSSSATADSIEVTLRNNNQDRDIDSFNFVVYDTGGNVVKLEEFGETDGQFAMWISGAWSSAEADAELVFPVPKKYKLTSTTVAMDSLSKIEVYPIFTIEGQTKSCETATEITL